MSEPSPHYLGTYNGKASPPEIFERVAEADCVICLGVRFVDATSGWFSQSLDAAAVIPIQPFDGTIGDDYFAGVAPPELLEAILEREIPVSHTPPPHPLLLPAPNPHAHAQTRRHNP